MHNTSNCFAIESALRTLAICRAEDAVSVPQPLTELCLFTEVLSITTSVSVLAPGSKYIYYIIL